MTLEEEFEKKLAEQKPKRKERFEKMKVIKFRAWDKKMKVWEYGKLGDGKFPEFWMGLQKGQDTFPLDIKSLGQFTGLKDKKGKEIYEGDIVEYSYCLFIVFWDDDGGCFYLDKIKEDHIIHDIRMNRLDVRAIVKGNIYENPELL